MCNPRKVMIHVNRSIEQAWRQSVEQRAIVSDGVTEIARINADISLAAEMGAPALAMLERVLAGEFEGFTAWDRDDRGHYRHTVGDVSLVFDPVTQRMAVEARFTELVTAEARAAVEANGMVVGEVAAEAIGHYYSDNFAGRTRERAEREATAQAEHNLQTAIAALGREQNAARIAQAQGAAREQAEELARVELARRQAETRTALRERLQVVLAEAEEQVQHIMNRAVGEAYRQTLRELVLRSGGRVVTDERTGSVINLELEIA